MGRRKGVTVEKSVSVIEPIVNKSAEDYIDYTSAIIRYGLLMHYKANNDTKLIGEDGQEVDLYSMPIDLNGQQVQYINMLAQGMTSSKACKAIGIDTSYPILWGEEQGSKSVYAFCMEAIRKTQAIRLEDKVWESAINNGKKDILAMFALKARMPEYRDNQPISGNNVVQLNITVDREQYVVDTNTTIDVGESNG